MAVEFVLRGAGLGFAIAAPVGPIGILCIRRALAQGRAAGFVSGLGAATADAVYGAVAAFGLTFISDFLKRQEFWLGLLGGLFLCYLGVRTFLAAPANAGPPVAQRGTRLLAGYLSTLLLTLANPATIFSFMALFAGFGVGRSSSYAAASAMVLGVFLGSAAWWLLLSNGVALARSKFTPAWMQRVNRFSGVLLLAFGVFSLSSLARNDGLRPNVQRSTSNVQRPTAAAVEC